MSHPIPHTITSRDSSMELLRIVCMFFVVLLHFNNHGVVNDILDFQGNLTLRNLLGHTVESFAIVAVNAFVLLSGIYGIHFKLRGLFRLYLQCFFCGIAGYFLYIAYTGEPITIDAGGLCFAFTHNHWWFVTTYLYLYFSAPFLNAAIQKMDKKQLERTIVALSFCLFYLGYVRGLDMGMSYFQFVYLYLLGRYVGLYVTADTVRKHRWNYLVLYVGCSICTLSIALLKQHYHFYIPYLTPYVYNSWFVVGGALGLVLFFKSLSFQSRIVNWIASSAFAVYLLQESPYFGFRVLYPFTESLFLNFSSTALAFLAFFAFSMLFFFAAVLLDKMGNWLLKPAWLVFDKIEKSVKSSETDC